MRFRNAGHSDIPFITSVYNATISERMVTADTAPLSESDMMDILIRHRPQYPLWIGEHEGEAAGYLSFKPFYGRPAYEGTAEISIYLDAQQRNKGLGSMMMKHAIEKAPSLGFHTLLGFIFTHNKPSIGLVEKFGFQAWGLLPDVALMDGNYFSLGIYGLKIKSVNNID